MTKIKLSGNLNFDIFNSIRGLALLCVLGIHTICVIHPVYPETPYSWIFNTPAWLAMWIFFFLSGYLLGKGFYKNKYTTDIKGIFKFYASRFVRIAPMYFFFLLILFLFYDPIWFLSHTKEVLRLLTFTYNGNPGIVGVGATWFVSTIVQLYILAPLAYKFALSKINKNKWLFLMVIILFGLSYRLIINYFKLDYWQFSLTSSFANIDLFFGGMLLNSITTNSKNNKIKPYLRIISILGLIVLILLPMLKITSNWLYMYIYPTLVLFDLILISYSFDNTDKGTISQTAIKNILIFPIKIIGYLGVVSFPFYLYHSNILEIYMKILKNPSINNNFIDSNLYVLVYICMFATCFLISWFMHIFIESPSNNFRNNFIKENNNKND